MKMPKFLIFTASILILLACDNELPDDECCERYKDGSLTGTWLLYEQGYSPGSGYITVDIPATPAQTIQFSDGQVTSTIDGFEEISYYKVLTDTVYNTQYVALYKSDPNLEENPYSTYSFDLSDSTLKLYYRWCVEGCHMGLRRLDGHGDCIDK